MIVAGYGAAFPGFALKWMCLCRLTEESEASAPVSTKADLPANRRGLSLIKFQIETHADQRESPEPRATWEVWRSFHLIETARRVTNVRPSTTTSGRYSWLLTKEPLVHGVRQRSGRESIYEQRGSAVTTGSAVHTFHFSRTRTPFIGPATQTCLEAAPRQLFRTLAYRSGCNARGTLCVRRRLNEQSRYGD